MIHKTFSNRYGRATLTSIEPPRPVRNIRAAEYPAGILLTIEDAELLTAITENRGVQVAFPYPLTVGGRALVVLHDSPTTAAACRVEIATIVSAAEARDILAQPTPAICI